jgi:type IV fimbrial biogenesis protein FimT
MTTHKHSFNGFTLIELMVVMAVLAVLAAVAVPAMTEMATSSRLNTDSGRWAASVNLGRSEAIKRNRRVTLCPTNGGNSCVNSGGGAIWSNGWAVGFVADGVWTLLHAEPAAAAGYRIEVQSNNTPVYSVVFQPTGVDSTDATATMCRSSPSGNLQQRQVSVSTTGRVQFSKASRTTACPE